MPTLDYFEVSSTEKTGGEMYKQIASKVIGDHNLLRIIATLKIFIDPALPVFVAVGTTRSVPRSILVSDIAGVTYDNGKIKLNIADETYLAELLAVLWKKFGRDNVVQPDRFSIEILTNEGQESGFEDLAVLDPTESIFKDLIYGIQVICPEGFKVKRQSFQEGRFWFVASENTLPEDVSDLVNEQFQEIEAHI